MKLIQWLAIAAATALAGCATLPAPSETQGGMLAFPLDIKNQTSFPIFYVFEYTIYDEDTNLEVDRIQINPAQGSDVSTYGPYPAGDYYIGMLTTRVKDSSKFSFSYKPTPREVRIDFSIEEDTVTLINQTQQVHQYMTEGRKFRTANGLADLTDEVKEKALESLAKQDKENAWTIEVME